MVLASYSPHSYQPDFVSLFVEAAKEFDQKSIPFFERQKYVTTYQSHPEFFNSRMSAIIQRAGRCASTESFRQIHALDCWQPTSHPILASFDYRYTNGALLKEFDRAQNDDNWDVAAPSADLTDFQCLLGHNTTRLQTIEFPVIAIYPGKETTIFPQGLQQFFNYAVGYHTTVSITETHHPLCQHKTQNLVSDWMIGSKRREVYVIHPLGTHLPFRHFNYEPLFYENGQPVESFNRVAHYITYERPLIEKALQTSDDRF